MKKSTTIVLSICLMMLLMLCLAACSGGETPQTTAAASEASEAATTKAAADFSGDKYVNEGTDYAIKNADLPADYALIPHEQFAAGFKCLVDGTITSDSKYADVAKAFGAEGIKMAGIKYEGYAYYSWYSDKDYQSDVKTHVLVTFKDNGKAVTYYAYSSEGIAAEDVK